MLSGDAPDRGDIVWIDLDRRVGREQSEHRPFLVLSPVRYNRQCGMLIGCPMTSRIKNNPFEVVVGGRPPSAVLVDQVRTVDWHARGSRFKERAGVATVEQVLAKLATLIGGDA